MFNRIEAGCITNKLDLHKMHQVCVLAVCYKTGRERRAGAHLGELEPAGV